MYLNSSYLRPESYLVKMQISVWQAWKEGWVRISNQLTGGVLLLVLGQHSGQQRGGPWALGKDTHPGSGRQQVQCSCHCPRGAHGVGGPFRVVPCLQCRLGGLPRGQSTG